MHCPSCGERLEVEDAAVLIDDYIGGDRQLTTLLAQDVSARVLACFGCGFWAPRT